MRPAQVFQDIKKQYSDLLLKHPEERGNSVGFVYENLERQHCAAAIWMYEKHRMALTAYNFHDLIVRWEECELIAKLPDLMIVNSEEIPPGSFHMSYLVGYFQQWDER